jgi:hypothetical protein
MSVDVQLAHQCPHMIMEEVVALNSDRQSVETQSPIASSNTVRMLVNNDFYIPTAGLFSQAQLIGEFGGPFRVDACDNDLTVTSSTETTTISLPDGRVSAETVARMLITTLSDVAVEVTNGRLILTDTSRIGQASRILVSGSAASALGFRHQRGARGRMVYPPWGVYESPVSPDAYGGRRPKFRLPVMGNPLLKVTYVTQPQWCRRCGTTFIESDVRFDLQGDTLLVANENLLYQAALKIILTRIQSNPFHPSYGSGVTSRLGMKAIGATATLLTEDVQKALSVMQNLQGKQAKYQAVSRRERLYAVQSVRVMPHESDPTTFLVNVVVTNASGEPVEITIVFSVAGVVALAGSNGLSLGLESTGLSATESAQFAVR